MEGEKVPAEGVVNTPPSQQTVMPTQSLNPPHLTPVPVIGQPLPTIPISEPEKTSTKTKKISKDPIDLSKFRKNRMLRLMRAKGKTIDSANYYRFNDPTKLTSKEVGEWLSMEVDQTPEEVEQCYLDPFIRSYSAAGEFHHSIVQLPEECVPAKLANLADTDIYHEHMGIVVDALFLYGNQLPQKIFSLPTDCTICQVRVSYEDNDWKIDVVYRGTVGKFAPKPSVPQFISNMFRFSPLPSEEEREIVPPNSQHLPRPMGSIIKDKGELVVCPGCSTNLPAKAGIQKKISTIPIHPHEFCHQCKGEVLQRYTSLYVWLLNATKPKPITKIPEAIAAQLPPSTSSYIDLQFLLKNALISSTDLASLKSFLGDSAFKQFSIIFSHQNLIWDLRNMMRNLRPSVFVKRLTWNVLSKDKTAGSQNLLTPDSSAFKIPYTYNFRTLLVRFELGINNSPPYWADYTSRASTITLFPRGSSFCSFVDPANLEYFVSKVVGETGQVDQKKNSSYRSTVIDFFGPQMERTIVWEFLMHFLINESLKPLYTRWSIPEAQNVAPPTSSAGNMNSYVDETTYDFD